MMEEHIQTLLDSDSDNDDDKNYLLCMGAVVGYYIYEHSMKRRALFHVRDRLEWLQHVEGLAAEGNNAFKRLYRMNYDSFTRLCNHSPYG